MDIPLANGWWGRCAHKGRKMQPGTMAVVRPGSCADHRDCFVNQLRDAIGLRSFQHWFQGRTSIAIEADTVRISVASQFQLAWMQRRFARELAACAQAVVGSSASLIWDVAAEGTEAQPEASAASVKHENVETTNAIAPSEPVRSLNTVGSVSSDRSAPASRDGRRFSTLEEFVVGRCNELAVTAARHVCEAPGEACNPLYLYGPVGTGKTHVAEGVYKGIRRLYSDRHVLFMTAEAFANQFTHALRTHTLPGFRQRFRSVDVLVIDDVDFLDGKRGIQEEFLHTFQQLVTHGKQVVLTANSHPRLLSQMSHELVSRFLSGMVCRLEGPDLETRRKIAQAKAIELGTSLADEVLDLVARRFTNNVREIEGALNSIHTWFRMTNKRISVATAKHVLSDLERDCVRVVKLTDVEAVVAELFGVPALELRSDCRTRTISQPRMLAMYLARKHTQAAYKEIGEHFGGRNHSTVMSAERKIETWLRTDPDLRIGGQSWRLSDVLERLERQLQAS